MSGDSLTRKVHKILSPNSTIKKIVTVSFQVAVLQAAALCLGYILQVFLARWLGAIEYGKYCYALSWVHFFCVIASLGLPSSALKFIPQYIAAKNWNLLIGFHKQCLTWLIFAGFFLSATISLIIVYIPLNENYQNCLLISAWITPAGILIGYHAEYLRAIHRVISALLLPQIIYPVLIIVFSGIIYFNCGILSAVDVLFLILTANIIIVVFQWQLVKKHKPNDFKKTKEKYNIKLWLKVSLSLFAINLFNFLMAQTDILVIGSFMGPESAGIYSVAAKIAGLVSFILVTVNTLAAPIYAALYSEDKFFEMQKISTNLAHIMFWPSLILAFIIFFCSSSILKIFGSDFIQGKNVLYILMVGHLFHVSTGAVGYLTDLTGLQFQGAVIRGIGALLNVALTLALVPYAGLEGAAFATSGCLIFWNVCLLCLVIKKHGINPSIWDAVKRMIP